MQVFFSPHDLNKMTSTIEDEGEEQSVNFQELGLNNKISTAISLLGWESPTLIQEKAIPLALEGLF